MELIKVLRLRPSITTIEERLSYTVVQQTGYKGAISDVRLEVYVENITSQDATNSTSYDEFELKFIEISKVSGSYYSKNPVKRYSNINNQFGDTRNNAMQYVIGDFIRTNAYTILLGKILNFPSAEKQAPTYYKIVQDPWLDEPPLIRSYGNDPYFLNNGLELTVFWTDPNTPEAGGVVYSNDDGSESYNKSLIYPGKTPSVPFGQDDQDIEYAKSEKKKISKNILGVDNSTGVSRFYTISSNDIKITGTGSIDTSVIRDNFPGDNLDIDIINKFIDIWKKKVPNYDLKICQPSYYPSLIDLEFKSPLENVTGLTSSNDNQPAQSSDPNEVKFKLSIVYDKNKPIKADADATDINIYVGEPPKEGEFLFDEAPKEGEFLFDEDEFDDLALLDEEYTEVEFKGLDEIISELSQKYVPPDNKVDEVDQSNDSDRGSDGTIVTYIEGASVGAGGNNNNVKVKSALKKATDATGGGGSGRCARFTFNHANNFVKALIGKSLTNGATTPAGGNANQASYHNALVKLGYTKKETVKLTKSALKKTLETSSNWDLGDVVAYWGISTEFANKGGVQYGHTQIFTNGVHGSSNKWTSDNFGNFNCAFVYNSYKVDTWQLVILKSPTAGKTIA